MIGSIRRRAAQSVLATLSVCFLSLAAQAGTINIILGNLDVSYLGNTNGGVFFDSMGGVQGGVQGDPTFADSISNAVFELDGNIVSTLDDSTDPLFGDFRIINIGPSLTKNVLSTVGNNGGGFGFNFFSDSGFQLSLGMTNVQVLVNNNVFFFTGEATVLPGQNLPGGLQFDTSQPVVFSYTATLPAVQAGATTGSALSSGALTISGVAIPEPGTLVLMAGAFPVALGLMRRPRRAA